MVLEDVCSDLRFATEREHHDGRRSPASKLLVESSIESLGELIHDLEPPSRLETCCGRAVIHHPAFNKFAHRSSSTRIPPFPPGNACRAAFVTSSYTIIPSSQQRSDCSHKREAARMRSTFI